MEETNRTPIEPFVGREVTIDFRNASYQGKVNKPEYEQGYVDLKPSIVFSFNGETARLETEAPLRLSLQLFQKEMLYAITPHENGFLENRVNQINNPPKKEALGFKP